MNAIGSLPQLGSRCSNWKPMHTCKTIPGSTMQNQARPSGDAEPTIPGSTVLDGTESFDGTESVFRLCKTPTERPNKDIAFARPRNIHGNFHGRQAGRCKVDLVTMVVIGLILVSYLVGALTSSIEVEQQLPHRY